MTAEPIGPLTRNPESIYAWAPDPDRQRRRV